MIEYVSQADRLQESVEAMRVATEEIDRKLGGAFPKGLAAEVEDIKRRLSALEARLGYI